MKRKEKQKIKRQIGTMVRAWKKRRLGSRELSSASLSELKRGILRMIVANSAK